MPEIQSGSCGRGSSERPHASVAVQAVDRTGAPVSDSDRSVTSVPIWWVVDLAA